MQSTARLTNSKNHEPKNGQKSQSLILYKSNFMFSFLLSYLYVILLRYFAQILEFITSKAINELNTY